MTHRITTNCQRFRTILHSINRRAELLRLVAWAKRKRLSGPLRCYLARLEAEELRLNFYMLRHPRLARWLHRFHRFNNLILPPRYSRRGSAVLYRRNNLTHVY